MPRGDKTGPEGAGPMTGRRMGSCQGNTNSNFFHNLGFGRRMGNSFRGGFKRGFGNGQRMNNAFPEYPDKESIKQEIELLKKQLTFLENEYEKRD